MFEKQVTLVNEVGLHARPASVFIQSSVRFISDISVIKDDVAYNAKSIMSVLSMGASKGDTITIRAEGEDEQLAVERLVDLCANHLEDY